jgi:F1F0 ATPase subunit 2
VSKVTIGMGIWAAAFLVGAALAALYLALLWAGTRSLAGHRPVRDFLLSALARAGLVLGALAVWILYTPETEVLVAGLLGFVAVRLAATRAIELRSREDG